MLFFNNRNNSNEIYNIFGVLNELTRMFKEQIFTDCLTATVCDKYLFQISIKRNKPEWLSPKTYSFLADIDDKQLANTIEDLSENKTTEKKIIKPNRPSFIYKENLDVNDIKKDIKNILPKQLQNFIEPKEFSVINKFKIFSNEIQLEVKHLDITKIIAQMDEKFIIGIINVNGSPMLTAFDQHASHERIQLEKLEKSLESDLLYENCRILLKLTSFDLSELMKNKEKLAKFNFVIKEENQQLYLVRIPKIYDSVFTFSDFLSAIHSNSLIPSPLLNALKYKACRSSVKFGDCLSLEKCKEICELLKQCTHFNKCAHGRPTFYPLCSFPPSQQLSVPIFQLLNKKKPKKL